MVALLEHGEGVLGPLAESIEDRATEGGKRFLIWMSFENFPLMIALSMPGRVSGKPCSRMQVCSARNTS
ncbi:MAG TPA: hypothetical protein VE093_46460 [Polyangiaceae bacterium]|nr:hypothetical protein [Polyangiaceae bacterium]